MEAAEENLDTFEDEAENVAGDKATSIEDDEFIDCLLTLAAINYQSSKTWSAKVLSQRRKDMILWLS